MRLLILLFIVKFIFADELIDELKDDMQKFSNVAIETNQNVDYMPYIISTLTNEELSTLGIKNLKEALTLIANVDISIGMAGVSTPIFRGSNPFAFGQSKLLIDGVVVNDALFGGYYHYLEMPTFMIKRVEVVRGAGSIKDSVNAYSGLINVVTFMEKAPFEKSNSNIFSSLGSYSYKMGGFNQSYIKDDLKLHLNFFYQEDDKSLPSGYDRFKYNEMNSNLARRGEVPVWLKNHSFGFSLANNGLELKLRSFRNKSGVSYGQSFTISEDLSDYLDITTNFIDIKKSIKLNTFTTLIFNLNYLSEERKLQNRVMPAGTKMMMPNSNIWSFSNGGYFLVDYKEDVFKEEVELNFDLDRHNIVAGANFNQIRVTSNDSKMTKPDPNPMGMMLMPQELLSLTKRDFFTLYFKDRFNLNEKTTIESSLIYQKFSDLTPEFNPRVSIVYRQNPTTIYKAMYTHSFREPSLRERFIKGAHYYQGNSSLNKEKVNSFELAYIKKYLNNSFFKLNLFYLLNKNEIVPRHIDRVFTNQRESDIYGFEVEYKTKFTQKDIFYINYSLTDGVHKGSDSCKTSISNVSRDVIKGYYDYKLTNNLNFATIIKYMGEKDRVGVDDREKLKAYKSIDTTLRYVNKKSDYEITFSIKNLLNEEIKLPAPPMSYEDDFFAEKRSFFISFKKAFK